ncbi:MAG: efflux RND transporter periplasmic adaptor subunit [Candidatus Sumerlaeaceae bacterium]
MRKPLVAIAFLVIVTLLGTYYWDHGDRMANQHDHHEAKTATLYTCPMHPTYTSPKPGSCPICGMDLVPMEQTSGHGEHSSLPSEKTGGVEGRVAITLTAEKQQKIGVRLAKVEKSRFSKTARLTAVLEHDETRYARIAPRVSGWIQKLYANYTGQHIDQGSPLMSVYSPDVLSATTEYLIAFEQVEKMKAGTSNIDLERAKNLLSSTRERLALWEIGPEQISEIEKTRRPLTEVVFHAPVSGHIIAKTAIEGRYFAAGETLFEIGDLSHLWVRVYIYEQDYPYTKVGQKAIVHLPSLNQTVEGTITFIYPHIDEFTRRAEARIEVANPEHVLRPGLWGYAEVELDYGTATLVPPSAVIDTGERYVAFAIRDNGQFEPRDVEIGVKTDDFYQVLEGLREGDTVVVNPLFLIDAESQLRAAIGGLSAHKH